VRISDIGIIYANVKYGPAVLSVAGLLFACQNDADSHE